MTEKKFDVNFQLKVLGNLIKDMDFFLRITQSLSTEFFEIDAHKWIYAFVKDYFNTYKDLPSCEILAIANHTLNEPFKNGKENLLRQMIEVNIKQLETIQIDKYIQNTSKDFCIEQIYAEAILKSIGHLENGRTDLIQFEIEQAHNKTIAGEKLSYDYFDSTNIKSRLIENVMERTSTGWDMIDRYTKSGLANGEVGFVMAPTGVGKTFYLVNIAYGALLQKKNVVYMSLEMTEKAIANRMDAILADISLNELCIKADTVEERVEKFKESLGKFEIVEFKRKPNLNDIKLKLIQLKNVMNIDTLIIDYAGLIKPLKISAQKRWDLDAIVEELVFVAKEFDVKLWSASQANRSALEADIIDLSHTSEAYSIAFHATIFITMSRTPEEREHNSGKFHLVKNRNGIDYLMFEINFISEMSRITVVRKLEHTNDRQQFSEDEQKAVADKLAKIRNKGN